ncbi:helix-turn-helix domain-containing protein [Micromonospora ureilytica]|uniref:TetR/AcrR family transcriptional regulator n=1 Tax=Micromonospora ureilytica TaxID=709868 RepID=UPI0033F70ED9
MSGEVRREQSRLNASRVAVALFWDQGLQQTSGEDIAARLGISVRTLWRHFRSKEATVEPVLSESMRWIADSFHRWPNELSIEEHLADHWGTYQPSTQQIDDDLAGMRVLTMAITEPQLRTGWLIVCAELEQQLIPTVAHRLSRAQDDLVVRVKAAAVAAAFRVAADDVAAQGVHESPADRHGRPPTQIPGRDTDAVAILAHVVRLAAPDLADPVVL